MSETFPGIDNHNEFPGQHLSGQHLSGQHGPVASRGRARLGQRLRPPDVRCRVRAAIALTAFMMLAGCGAASPEPRAGQSAAPANIEPARALARCVVGFTADADADADADAVHAAAHPTVQARCRFIDVTLARHVPRASYLRDLLRAGRTPADVSEQEIRATAEYRSFMDPRQVWQWHDRVTEHEALAACRAMLVDLHEGRPVRWEADARGYLERLRRGGAVDRVSHRVPGGGAPTTRDDLHGERPGVASPADARRPDQAPSRPDDRPDGRPDGRPGDRHIPRALTYNAPSAPIDIDDTLDRGWRIHAKLREAGNTSSLAGHIADSLERALTSADAHLGALAVILAGSSISVTVVMGTGGAGEALVFTAVADGVMVSDKDLAMRLSTPLFVELSRDMRQLETLSREYAHLVTGVGAAGIPGEQSLARLSAQERTEYRTLLRKPRAELSRSNLERVHALHRQAGLADRLRADTVLHKAERWADYQARGGAWGFERWSVNYDGNMVRAKQAHERADRYWRELGWGQREVRVEVEKGITRVLDIADKRGRRGVEVKTGYVTHSADVAYQAARDAVLATQYNWTISWYVDGRCSEPLRQVLRNGGIQLIETRPNTPIKEL